jgi:hypothetical protein
VLEKLLAEVKKKEIEREEKAALEERQKEVREIEDKMKVYKSLAIEQRREIEMLRKNE